MQNLTQEQIAKLLAGSYIQDLVDEYKITNENIDEVFDVISDGTIYEIFNEMLSAYIDEKEYGELYKKLHF